MNILISGATGLVGTELGKALVAQGHSVFVLSRDRKRAQKQCPFPHTPLNYGELNPKLGEQIDAVVNLAGANLTEQRWNADFKQQIRDSRIKTTQMLVDWANQSARVKAFVSTSAVGIYGDTGTQEVTEAHPLNSDFLGQVCQDWEAPLAQLKPSVRGVILRVGIVLSEKGGALAKMVPPIQAGVGGALASGQQLMSWIDIDDLVNMYVFALQKPIQGTFNAVGPEPCTNQALTEAIATRLGVGTFLNVPFFALRLVVGEMAAHLIESQKISSQKIQQAGFKFQKGNLTDSVTARVPQLSNMQRRHIYEQWIPKTKDEIFPFFADAHNLEQITPPSLNFKILSVSTDGVQKGTIIKYKLKIDGIPVGWTTLIKEWEPPHRFVDNQEKGPYRKWYHLHRFDELAGGTLMTDQVDLEMPLGKLGYVAASWKVLRDVNKIFAYRREVIYDLFCKSKN